MQGPESTSRRSELFTPKSDHQSEPSFAQIFEGRCVAGIPDSYEIARILSLLIHLLVKANRIDSRDARPLLDELLSQEPSIFASMGISIALSELRSDRVAETMGSIGVSFSGVDLDSAQGAPTKLIFVALSPRYERERHTHILNRLFAMTRQKSIPLLLNKHDSPDEIHKHLCELDHLILN